MSDILKHLSIIINYFINRTPLFFSFFLYSNAGHFDPLMYLCMFYLWAFTVIYRAVKRCMIVVLI